MSLLSSLDPTSLLLGGIVVLCVLWWLSTRRPPGLPPGPGPALPLLGHLHLLAKDPRPQFRAWRRQYGDVFSLYMGGRLVVVLASYSAIREALVTFADVFSDRPHDLMVDYVLENQGLSFASGSQWKEQRKTALEILRAMGMGKNVLADKIQEEITHYIRAIKDHQGAPVDLARLTQTSISNNICSIVIGKRFDDNDPDFNAYIESLDEVFKLSPEMALVNFIPVLRHVPSCMFPIKRMKTNDDLLTGFTGHHLAGHQKALQQDEDTGDCMDFIYCYLQEIRKRRARNDMNTTVNEINLRRIVVEMFAAGTETTSTVIRWALLFFLHYPHVQDKCFQEINDVIGPHRPPSMSDKAKLTYLEATVCEVLRKGDILPLALQHATASDVTFRGYVIPKGTMVIPNLSCVLQDPDIWGDPENFRPERFIDLDGNLVRSEELIPFSTGRRVCLGEPMARMELFLYLATLIQHFRFLPPEEGQLPSLEGELGLSHVPKTYEIRAVPRM